MKLNYVVVAIVFVAGLGIGYFARSAVSAALERKDLAAIEKPHQEDIQVTLSQDPKRASRHLDRGCGALHAGKPAGCRQAGHWGRE
jgi:hypothetical protein